jgi:hypothetical protein
MARLGAMRGQAKNIRCALHYMDKGFGASPRVYEQGHSSLTGTFCGTVSKSTYLRNLPEPALSRDPNIQAPCLTRTKEGASVGRSDSPSLESLMQSLVVLRSSNNEVPELICCQLLCHCLDCRKIGGAAFSNNIVVSDEHFKLQGP